MCVCVCIYTDVFTRLEEGGPTPNPFIRPAGALLGLNNYDIFPIVYTYTVYIIDMELQNDACNAITGSHRPECIYLDFSLKVFFLQNINNIR